jgi:hypothetical protein
MSLDPSEQLLSALLLQVFYGIRSERRLKSNWTTIFCTAGSWGFRLMTRSGTHHLLMTARTSMARSVRTTPMRVPATQTAGFTARRRGGRRSFAISATPPWRTGLAVAGMVTHANGTAERRASEIMLKARAKLPAAASRPVRTRHT